MRNDLPTVYGLLCIIWMDCYMDILSLVLLFSLHVFYFVKLVKYCVCQCFNKELLSYLFTYLGVALDRTLSYRQHLTKTAE